MAWVDSLMRLECFPGSDMPPKVVQHVSFADKHVNLPAVGDWASKTPPDPSI